MNEIEAKMGMAILTVHLIEWAKNTEKIPWINHYTNNLTRFVAVMAAILSAVGVHSALTGTFGSGGSLTITWPPADVLVTGLWNYALQWGMQRAYKRVIAPTSQAIVTVTALDKKGVDRA